MSKYRNQENQGDFVPHGNYKETNPFERLEDKIEFIRIYDLFEPVRHTNRDVYELTERVFTIFKSILKIYEERNLKINHFEFFELVYKVVEQTIYEIQRIKYNSIDDLTVLNLNTLSLFLEPNNVTEEELKYTEKLIDKESDGYEVEIKLPINSQRNYFINVKRILDENNSNPDFNESILNMFDRNRDTN
jgi:hypothetical protein